MSAARPLPVVELDDLVDPDRLRDLREQSWAVRSERGIEVLAYRQGMQMLDHRQLLKGPSFQYRLDQLGIQGEARRYMDMGITNKEGEERRRMRASMGALFRPAQIAKLRENIRGIANSVLDEIDEPTQFDLMRLCWEIPARAYCELVSVPYDLSSTVIRIADSVLGALLTVDRTRRDETEAAILESVDIVREHLNARRGDLGDDFTSVMIRQQEEGLMTEEQLVAQSFALLQASVDNTAHQMGNTFGMLLSRPERWQSLVANERLRGPIIEEAVRLFPRFGTIFRLAAQDLTIDDVTIAEGEWAFVSVRAAQRDPAAFKDPDEYRLDREETRPLMFGAGPYNCLGQNLARMEIDEALRAVSERYPALTLTGEWERREVNAVSETLSLAVDLDTPAAIRQLNVPSAPVANTPAAAEIHADTRLGAGEPTIDCDIAAMGRVAEDVVAIELRARSGVPLPAWEPGAHIDLCLPGGVVRQYSLCGTRNDEHTYRIAVLRESAGTGGSAFVHERLSMATPVAIRGPRNHFSLGAAPHLLFVAGGIGITAILPMAREASRRGDDWSLLYLGRRRERLAFLDEVSDLPPGRVRVVASEEEGRLALDEYLSRVATDTDVYACGPSELLAALAATWPEDQLHVERFEPDTAALAAAKEAFTIRLTKAGQTLEVPADRSILDVVEEAGINWPSSCREGTCGSCEARIVAGAADHRDAVLTSAERKRNEYLMVCVSRAVTSELSLEI